MVLNFDVSHWTDINRASSEPRWLTPPRKINLKLTTNLPNLGAYAIAISFADLIVRAKHEFSTSYC